MSWAKYVVEVAGTDNQSEIARALNLPASTISRWLAGAEPKVSSVVLFADHYDRDYTEAFLAAADLPQQRDPAD